MPVFKLRPIQIGTDNSRKDYVFVVDGKESGRCYETRSSTNKVIWVWTVFGSSLKAQENSLEEAQEAFKRAWAIHQTSGSAKPQTR